MTKDSGQRIKGVYITIKCDNCMPENLIVMGYVTEQAMIELFQQGFARWEDAFTHCVNCKSKIKMEVIRYET